MDCDHAWHEILEESQKESHVDYCDYCLKLYKPEDLNPEDNH